MKRHFNNTMLLLLLFVSFASFAQNEKDVQAKIKVVQTDNIVSIYATAVNHTDNIQDNLSYSLLALKKAANGNLSKNTQSGAFILMPNESKTLSLQKLNIDPNGKINVFLFIRSNDKLLSKDTLVIGTLEKKFDNKPIDERNIEISGLIIENVLTKPGKDFYEMFSQINRSNGISYPFVITINEKPALGGRNSEISILINDNIIFKFNSQPNEEFLKNAAQQANRKIYSYYTKRSILYKNEKLF
jgi:hypothetical protein